MSDERHTVCLFGAALNAGNKGVAALATSFLSMVLRVRPDARLWLLCANLSHEEQSLSVGEGSVAVEVANYRLSPKAPMGEQAPWILLAALAYRFVPIAGVRRRLRRFSRWIDALAQADFVGDICGGDSFSDIYGLRRFLTRAFPSLSALAMGKSLVLLPQTYGPFGSRFVRLLARFIMKRSFRILARDRESLELVNAMLGRTGLPDRARLCPDVAFALTPASDRDVVVTPRLDDVDSATTLIGLNVSGLLYRGGYGGDNMFGLKCDYRAFVHELAKRLLEQPGTRLLIAPHEFGPRPENDPAACREVWHEIRARHPGRAHLVESECGVREIKGVIGRCDFFVGSRMHACIAALSQGVPSVGVAYSRKFKGVFETAGVGDMVVDPRELDLDEALAACMARFRDREQTAGRLAVEMPETRDAVLRQVTELFSKQETSAPDLRSERATELAAR